MIKSMTGYGKGEGTFGHKKFTIEIKSLNSKQLDMNVRMPSAYKEKELELRSYLGNHIGRGKVDLTIYYESTGEEKKVQVNKDVLRSYYDDLRELAESIGQQDVDYMGLLMRIPDALKPGRLEFDENEWNVVMEIVKDALSAFTEYRTTEGDELEKDFELRVKNILEELENAHEPLQQRMERIQDRIRTNLDEFVDPEKVDKNRFEQELIYYLEKLDVSEEEQRLKSNCEHFLEALSSDDSNGKKLGFISQEIGREVNTLGSKANDADVQRIVVKMKDELEKIKEQILNVL